MTHTISIPFTPPSANVFLRQHWAQRLRLTNEWRQAVFFCCKEAKVPRLDVVTVEATIYFPDKRKRDEQNYYTPIDKLVLDSLVKFGFLRDDDPAHVTSFKVTFGVDKEKPRTEVTISTQS